MMALRAGARHVTAVERWLYLSLACKESLVANKFAPDRYKVIYKRPTDLALIQDVPIICNLLICNILDEGKEFAAWRRLSKLPQARCCTFHGLIWWCRGAISDPSGRSILKRSTFCLCKSLSLFEVPATPVSNASRHLQKAHGKTGPDCKTNGLTS